MKRKILVFAVLAAFAAASLALWRFFRSSEGAAEQPGSTAGTAGPRLIAAHTPAISKGRSSLRRHQADAALDQQNAKRPPVRRRRSHAKPPDYTGKEKRLSDAVQSALDEDDFERVVESAQNALKSSREEVRQEAVDALGWFGEKALVELTKAMLDKSKSVADSARSHVEVALTGMADQEQAFIFAATYLGSFGENEDAATMLSGVMTSAAVQLIDPEDPDSAEDVETARSNRMGIVEHLADLMKKGKSTAAAAREVYESIADEEWRDAAAAMKWANDIEEPEANAVDDEPGDDTEAESSGEG